MDCFLMEGLEDLKQISAICEGTENLKRSDEREKEEKIRKAE